MINYIFNQKYNLLVLFVRLTDGEELVGYLPSWESPVK